MNNPTKNRLITEDEAIELTMNSNNHVSYKHLRAHETLRNI